MHRNYTVSNMIRMDGDNTVAGDENECYTIVRTNLCDDTLLLTKI